MSQRLNRLQTVRLSDNQKLQDLNYFYDPVGNSTIIRDDAQEDVFFSGTIVSPDNDYCYYSLYRLIEAHGREQKASATFGSGDNSSDSHSFLSSTTPWDGSSNALQQYSQKYSYDAVGNILSLQHIASAGSYTRTYGYEATSNRLLSTQIGSSTPYTYSHDARGNMTAMPHLINMDYDEMNQMCHVLAGSVNGYYQYSGGQRVRKYLDKGSSVTEERIYFGNYEVFRKWTGTTLNVERTTLHVSDDSGRIAMLEKRTAGSDSSDAELVRYIYSNHLQSSALELDDAGSIISYEEYHPYGTTAYQAKNSAINAVAKRYRYTGKERDEETGLNYHGARYYAPWLGRWGAVDPLENKYAGLSSFNYCLNNPINKHDPDGKDPGDKDNPSVLQPISIPNTSSADVLKPTIAPRKELDFSRVMPSSKPEPVLSPPGSIGPLTSVPNREIRTGGEQRILTMQERQEMLQRQRRNWARQSTQETKSTEQRLPWEQEAHERYRDFRLHDDGFNKDGTPGFLLRLQQDRGFENLSTRALQTIDLALTMDGIGAAWKGWKLLGKSSPEAINISLGKNINLKSFADKTQTHSFHTWDAIPGYSEASPSFYNFESAFQFATNATVETKGAVLFNLEYVNIKTASNIAPNTGLYQPLSEFGGKSLWEMNLTTEWELSQILNNATLFNKTEFYKMGRQIPATFLK